MLEKYPECWDLSWNHILEGLGALPTDGHGIRRHTPFMLADWCTNVAEKTSVFRFAIYWQDWVVTHLGVTQIQRKTLYSDLY